MKVLNFGSLNIDKVYTVPHFIREKETLSASSLAMFGGGKGLNQSIALARAGIFVYHAGKIGADGGFLKKLLEQNGVDTTYIMTGGTDTGHAVIQVDQSGQNCILLYGGANMTVTKSEVDQVLEDFGEGDVLLLQNEISELDYIIKRAAQKGMRIFLNPSPVNERLMKCELNLVNLLILNEVEGESLTKECDPEKICDVLTTKYPGCGIMLTLGEGGSLYCLGKTRVRRDIIPTEVVDTTAAGDTFTGFFVSAILRGQAPCDAVELATRAASIAVSREGAAPSIPEWNEVMGIAEADVCAEEYVIGIDVGGTNIRLVSMGKSGEIYGEKLVSSRAAGTGEPLEDFFDIVGGYISGNVCRPAAIAAGFPAVFDKTRRQIISAPNLWGFDGCMLADEMKARFDVPVCLDRDASMLLRYDLHENHMEHVGSAVGIYIGTGIGTAIFLDGAPWIGADGAAGELGHIPLPGRKDVCSCGLKGCMELYAGGKALEKIGRERYPGTKISDLFSEHGDEGELLDFVDNIACAAADVINLLDPEILFLGGGVLAMREFPLEALKEKIVRKVRTTKAGTRDNIRFSAQKNPYNGACGAALFAYDFWKEGRDVK